MCVRDRRAELGLTQPEVDELGGPSVLTLRAVENNRAGRLSPRLRRSLERVLKWEMGSIEAVLEGGSPKEIQQSPTPSAPPPPAPGSDRFALARRVLSMKETFGKHRDQMEASARKALSEEITRSAREAEGGIIALMPWLDETERGEAIGLLAELRAEV